jgi:hypothetical protein
MLCARCFTPLSPASSGSSECARCGHVSIGKTYSLAMATTLIGNPRPDTQPELPTLAPSISATRYETVRLWADSLVRSHPAPIRQAVPHTRPTAQPYTLSLLVADTFGANASPAALSRRRVSPTRLQRLLAQTLGERLSFTKWAPALAGGMLATLMGLAACILVQLVWNVALAAFAPGLSDPVTGFVERTLIALLGGSPLKLFALANLAPALLASADPTAARMQLTPPLTSLMLIPILALLWGGALAASSDFTRRARYSVARGALVGPVYALLLTLLTVLGGSRFDGASLGLDGTATLLAAPNLTLFYELLWGTLFGALGGWIQLYGRRSLSVALARLSRLRFRRLIGSVVGASVALLYGLGGSLAIALVALVVMLVSGQAPQPLANAGQVTHLGGTLEGTLGLALLALTLAPSLAIWVYAYASGASIDVDHVTYAPSGKIGVDFTTLALNGGTQAPPHAALYLLALLPLVGAFAGGQVAARFAQAHTPRAAFAAGALVSLPLFAFTLILDTIATLSLQARLPGGTLIVDVAPSALHNALPILAIAALVAGLGGMSAIRKRGPVSPSRR